MDAKLDEIIYTQGIFQKLDETKMKALCYTLIAYALDGKNQGAGFGFPFDRTHLVFYQRLCAIYNTLENIGQDCIIGSKACKIHQALSNDLQALIQDLEVREAAESLKQKPEVFDSLREAMQIALPDSKKGLNDNGTEVNIRTKEYIKILLDGKKSLEEVFAEIECRIIQE